jgi:hypothetical protein
VAPQSAHSGAEGIGGLAFGVCNAKNARQLRNASSQGFNGPNGDDYLEAGIVKNKFLPA